MGDFYDIGYIHENIMGNSNLKGPAHFVSDGLTSIEGD